MSLNYSRRVAALQKLFAGSRGIAVTYKRMESGTTHSVSLRVGRIEEVLDTINEGNMEVLQGSVSFRIVAPDLVLNEAQARPKLGNTDWIVVTDSDNALMGGEFPIMHYQADSLGASYLVHCERRES
jgi:hypothetical protein